MKKTIPILTLLSFLMSRSFGQNPFDELEKNILDKNEQTFMLDIVKINIPQNIFQTEGTNPSTPLMEAGEINSEVLNILEWVREVQAEEKAHLFAHVIYLSGKRKSEFQYARFYYNGYFIGPGVQFWFFTNRDKKIISVHMEQIYEQAGRLNESFYFRNDSIVYTKKTIDSPSRTDWEYVSHKLEGNSSFFKNNRMFKFVDGQNDQTVKPAVSEWETKTSELDKISNRATHVSANFRRIAEYLVNHELIGCGKFKPKFQGEHEGFTNSFYESFNWGSVAEYSGSGLKCSNQIDLNIDSLGKVKFIRFYWDSRQVNPLLIEYENKIRSEIIKTLESQKWSPAFRSCKAIPSKQSLAFSFDDNRNANAKFVFGEMDFCE